MQFDSGEKKDMLKQVFEMREEFMYKICAQIPDAYPEWPVDLGRKSDQKAIREFAFRGMEELFEALLHLKNWKDHRNGVSEFDRDEFLEEMIDAYKYFTAILVLVGVDAQEFFDAYQKKHDIICARLEKTN